jgi:hypothetical protein
VSGIVRDRDTTRSSRRGVPSARIRVGHRGATATSTTSHLWCRHPSSASERRFCATSAVQRSISDLEIGGRSLIRARPAGTGSIRHRKRTGSHRQTGVRPTSRARLSRRSDRPSFPSSPLTNNCLTLSRCCCGNVESFCRPRRGRRIRIAGESSLEVTTICRTRERNGCLLDIQLSQQPQV